MIPSLRLRILEVHNLNPENEVRTIRGSGWVCLPPTQLCSRRNDLDLRVGCSRLRVAWASRPWARRKMRVPQSNYLSTRRS